VPPGSPLPAVRLAVLVSGAGTILEAMPAAGLFTAFPDRVLNTHPSLLPDFPGAHAVADALAAGVPTTGCTVHLATAALDNGPILAQTPVPVRPGDTPSILQERIKTVERRLYPAVIKSYGAALIRGTAPSK
jgi:phosphoribosylglycinamide formyltransferase-1